MKSPFKQRLSLIMMIMFVLSLSLSAVASDETDNDAKSRQTTVEKEDSSEESVETEESKAKETEGKKESKEEVSSGKKNNKQEKLKSDEYYLAYNFWYENTERAYSINYKTGRIIPAGTKVKNVRYEHIFRTEVVKFRVIEWDIDIIVHYQAKYWPNKNISEFGDELFTKKSLDERTKDMTEKEIEAIKSGRIEPGMSKEAVLISYGPPPPHQTPSLEMKQWKYWINRFQTQTINFDDKFKVDQVR